MAEDSFQTLPIPNQSNPSSLSHLSNESTIQVNPPLGSIAQGNPEDEIGIEEFDGLQKIEVSEAAATPGVAGFENNLGNIIRPQIDGKGKRPRKRGKGTHNTKSSTKTIDGTGKEGYTLELREKKRGEEGSKLLYYTREEMEALRFVDVDEQKKIWTEIYCGLGPSVSNEYDCLASNHNSVHFDPRKQFLKNKTASAAIFGEECENIDREMGNMSHFCDLDGNDIGGDPGLSEDCSEDDKSDADYATIQRPAFFVSGEPKFDSGPPQDGLEYLRRVRWEAEHIPRVKVVKIEKSKLNNEQTDYMPSIPDILESPEHLKPSEEWEDVFLHDFSELRLALSQQLEPMAIEQCSENLLDGIIAEKLENLTMGRVDTSQSGNSKQCLSSMQEGDTSHSDPNPNSYLSGVLSEWPRLSIILGMDSVTRVSTLRKWVKLVESMTSIPRNECAWLFALCTAVDLPLDGDTSASLRCLLRKCASLRAVKSELDDEVIMLNILATISGKYFRQSEIPTYQPT